MNNLNPFQVLEHLIKKLNLISEELELPLDLNFQLEKGELESLSKNRQINQDFINNIISKLEKLESNYNNKNLADEILLEITNFINPEN